MAIDNVKLGKNVKLFEPCNIYGCEIGDNCKIGCFVEIQKGVRIGKNCKIQPFAFIPKGVEIEDGVFIGPHVCFTNDKLPRSINGDGSLKSDSDWVVSKTIVRKGAAIGANATIVCGVEIGEFAMVGAGSVVTKNVAPKKLVVGNPARVVREGKDI
jgi:acetyltransferase-like isoleucine patch superfamily enzyme